MLLELEIKNFILIEHHKISFYKGFTSLTGETGAGKSIILEALNLLKGTRADSKYQKNKDQKTEVIAEFDITENKPVLKLLEDKDLLDEENSNNLTIRRVILTNGKSNSYINNTKSTLQDLKHIGEHLIEIHSQNSNKNLLIDEKQQEILDIYCNNKNELNKLQKLCKEYNFLNKEINKYINLKEENKSKIELIEYKISELEEIDIKDGEYEELNEEYKRLSNADQIESACEESIGLINSSLSNVYKMKELSELLIKNDNTKSIWKMVNEAIINLEETNNSLQDEKNSIISDDFRMNEIDNRLNKINILSKKHFIEPENFSEFYEGLKKELIEFDSFDEKIELLEIDKNKIKEEWNILAKKISKIRKNQSLTFSKEITEKIKKLKMKNANFNVLFEDNPNQEVNKNGIDKISFQISTNLGSEFESIKKAASGGEVSRIALAIQSLISKNYSIPIQIFDEVDVGIGGTTGNSIGLFLHEISKYSQVVGITHLPQVATFAEHNFFIHKEEINNTTTTHIKKLEKDDKLKEFSRMMGYETFTNENKDMLEKLIKNSEDMKKNEVS